MTMKTINYALQYTQVEEGNEMCNALAFVTSLHPKDAIKKKTEEGLKQAVFQHLRFLGVREGEHEKAWERLCEVSATNVIVESERGKTYEMSFVPVKYINC